MSGYSDLGGPRRHDVIDVDTGETIVTMLAFVGPGWVRMVCVAELQRKGYTLRRDEAERWRDALTAALAEIDAAHPDHGGKADDFRDVIAARDAS